MGGCNFSIPSSYPLFARLILSEKALVGTIASHIKNMFKGITEGYSYKLSKVYSHFPVTVKTSGNKVIIENFIGDYPTFIEPVYLEDNIEIGDDVLLGPNVYIGGNSKIEDYVEISNTIIFDNVLIGENIKLDNCVIGNNSLINCKSIKINDCVVNGNVNTKEELYKIMYKFE